MGIRLASLLICWHMLIGISYGQIGKAGALNYPINPPGASIDDGWYSATVKYYNLNTYTRSNYTLDVEVKNNKVVEIDFGNGGSIHDGYNSSGYGYYGGLLRLTTNNQGHVIKAETRVELMDGGTIVQYDVIIE